MLLRKSLHKGCLVLWVVLGVAQVCAQKTIVVPSSGIATIQQGIDAANTGDTVLVMPGTYSESLTINGKEITLTSQAGAAQTTIVGPWKTFALLVENTPSLATTISGFTITSDTRTEPGCTVVGVGVSVQSAGATIRQNVFPAIFDAVAVTKGAVTFEQNTVHVGPLDGDLCGAEEAGAFFVRWAQSCPGVNRRFQRFAATRLYRIRRAITASRRKRAERW